ncbi:unnamed protein product [Mytilus edulis]|uniref:Uncharacterized protein n=1 Tax=Mytilus edulis TaxID=6550 RepID=A0A8S3UFC5_MYTED|nr:unnamed protein product [Mytilus edulis]
METNIEKVEEFMRSLKEDRFKPFAPFDITYISNTNIIAVTSRGSNDIKIVDVKTKRVLKTYSLDSPCAGITYTEERLMLCNKTGIHELNQHDGLVKTIVSVNITSNAYVAFRGDKIYYTHLDNNSVTCCDFQGNIQWTFKNPKMTRPIGVTVDTAGNVFVAGRSSHNVVVISQDLPTTQTTVVFDGWYRMAKLFDI